MTHFTVDPATLQNHASAVAAVSGMVGTAAAAAEQVGLGGDAYGVIISPIMSLVPSRLLPNSTRMIKQAAELADAIVTGLHANSDVYQSIDDQIKQGLTSVEH